MLSIRVKIKRRSFFDNTVFKVRNGNRYVIKKDDYNEEYGIYNLGGNSVLCRYCEEEIFYYFNKGEWIKVESNL